MFQAYNLCSSQSDVNMAKDWEISRSDAAELLGFAFTLENDETVNLILDRAYLIHKSTHSDNSSSGISGGKKLSLCISNCSVLIRCTYVSANIKYSNYFYNIKLGSSTCRFFHVDFINRSLIIIVKFFK